MYYTNNNSSRYWAYGTDENDATKPRVKYYQSSKNTELSSDYIADDISIVSNQTYLVLTNTSDGTAGAARLKYISIEIDNNCNNNYCYTVTFDAQDGTCDTKSLNAATSNGTLSSLPVAELSGSGFVGWFTKNGDNEDWGEEFKTSTIVSNSLTVYAKYQTVNYYIVKFINDDSEIKTINVDKNTSIGDEWPENPSKLEYSFVGWFDGETKYSPSTLITKGVNLTAKYEKNIINVGDIEILDIATAGSFLSKNTTDSFNCGLFTFVESKDTAIQALTNGEISEINFNTSTANTYITFCIPKNAVAKVIICARASGTDAGTLTAKNGSINQSISFSSSTKYETKMMSISNTSNDNQNVYIYRNGKGVNVCLLRVEVFELSNLIKDSALVNTDVEANSAKDIIRIVSTISGVAFDNISSIKISLYKDGVAANGNPLSITKVYTSVTNAADLYGTADNTYYSILKITNAQDIKGSTLTVSTIVTYSDGSSCTSYTKSFVVPSAS